MSSEEQQLGVRRSARLAARLMADKENQLPTTAEHKGTKTPAATRSVPPKASRKPLTIIKEANNSEKNKPVAATSSTAPVNRGLKLQNNNDDGKKKPVAQKKKKTAVSLSDACFARIFVFLTMHDLCVVRDTCQRFSRLAYQAAANQFRRGEYVQLPKLEPFRRSAAHQCGPACELHRLVYGRDSLCKCHDYRAVDEEAAALMLMKFGKFITHLHINGRTGFATFCNQYAEGWNFHWMMNRCISLKSLKLEDFRFWNELEGLQRILQNVELIELKNCECVDVSLTRILKHAIQLTHIALDSCLIFQMMETLFFIAKLENLESLSIRNSYTSDVSPFRLGLFFGELSKSKSLEKLELDDIHVIDEHLNALTKMDSLKHLIFHNFFGRNNFFSSLANMKNLKQCELHTEHALKRPCVAFAESLFDVETIQYIVRDECAHYKYVLKTKPAKKTNL